ncbi:Flp pilus assembly protein TadG [Massilia sp. UYP11]|uniref:TadE/TadG family type IV pilus assembly protein n=1 Tax=Massilia sp. UYP11 TaxID=1756385 RepID=UPI003D247456
MAIAAPVFLLVVAIIEFSTVFLATLTLQHAVHEGSRFAITGDSAASQQAAGCATRPSSPMRDNAPGIVERNDI